MIRLFILALCISSALSSKKKQTEEPETKKTIPEVLQLMFPIVDTFSKYELNSDAFGLPDTLSTSVGPDIQPRYLLNDIWPVILAQLDGADLWNLSLTSKFFGAMLRGPKGFQTLLKDYTAAQLLSMLSIDSSERIIGEWAIPMLEYNNVKCAPVSINALEKRARSLEVLRKICSIVMIEVKLPPGAIDDIYGTFKMEDLTNIFYLPKFGEQRLFERFSLWQVARLIFRPHITSSHPEFDVVKPAIIAEYILPAWRGERQIPEKEKSYIKTIIKWSQEGYRKYFEKLMFALFLVTGEKRKANKYIRPLATFLEDLGFDWKTVSNPSISLEKYKAKAADEHKFALDELKIIYGQALQWNLDLNAIAKATSRFTISQNLLKAIKPEFFAEYTDISATSVLKICSPIDALRLKRLDLGYPSFKKRPEPEVVPALKRKRSDDDTDVPVKRHASQLTDPEQGQTERQYVIHERLSQELKEQVYQQQQQQQLHDYQQQQLQQQRHVYQQQQSQLQQQLQQPAYQQQHAYQQQQAYQQLRLQQQLQQHAYQQQQLQQQLQLQQHAYQQQQL